MAQAIPAGDAGETAYLIVRGAAAQRAEPAP